MTSSQPPTPGGYGPPPHGGQPGYPPPQGGQPGYPPPQGGQPGYPPPQGGQPGYPPPQGGQPGYPPPPGGQPGYPPPPAPGPQPGPPPGQPQGGPGYGAPPPYGPPPGGGTPYGQPTGTGGGFSFDVKKLRMADYVVVGGMIVFLVMALLPWVDVAHYLGFNFPGSTVNGFTFSGLVTFSFVLFFLAAAWAVLPAFTDVKIGFPRAWITVGLAGLGFILTLIAWIRSLTYGFEIWALIGLLAAAATAVFAFLGLLPEMHNRPALPGRLAGAAQWANQQAPDFPRQFGGAGAPGTPPTTPQPTAPPPAPPYGPPPTQPQAQPPQFTKPGGAGQGAPGPRIPGHGTPEPGIPGQGVPPGTPGAPGRPPYGPPSGGSQPPGPTPGGSTASGQTPPATPGGYPGTPGEDSQRPGNPA